jgi:hypothetical protein
MCSNTSRPVYADSSQTEMSDPSHLILRQEREIPCLIGGEHRWDRDDSDCTFSVCVNTSRTTGYFKHYQRHGNKSRSRKRKSLKTGTRLILERRTKVECGVKEEKMCECEGGDCRKGTVWK